MDHKLFHSPVYNIVLNIFRGIIFFCLIIPVLLSCEQDPVKAGVELLPEGDLLTVGYVDSLTVNAYTVENSSVNSGNLSVSPVGCYVDPVFGLTKGEVITEFFPSGKLEFGSNPVTDSVIFTFNFSGYYGDSLFNPPVTIYEYTDDIIDTTANFDVSGRFDPVPVSMGSVSRLADTLDIFRIKMTDAFGDALLNRSFEQNGVHRDTLYKQVTDSMFKSYFKGIYLSVDDIATGGGIYNVNLSGSETRITIYYHNDSSDVESAAFNMVLTNSANQLLDKRLSLYSHDWSMSRIKYLGDTEHKDTVAYLQSLAGTKVLLKIPGLDGLRSALGNISVTQAELIIPFDPPEKEVLMLYPLPQKLGLRAISGDGKEKIIQDDPYYMGSENALKYFGGYLDEEDNEYRFNIGKYLQDYWQGDQPNEGIYLFIAQNTIPVYYNLVNAGRVVINSGIHSDPIRLNLSYTVIP